MRPDDTDRFITCDEEARLSDEVRTAARAEAQRALDASDRHAKRRMVVAALLVGTVAVLTFLGGMLFADAFGVRPW
jgi:hypothetical protein